MQKCNKTDGDVVLGPKDLELSPLIGVAQILDDISNKLNEKQDFIHTL